MFEYVTESHSVEYNEHKIYGMLFKPVVEGKVPIVIICHGFNGSFQDNMNYAVDFAHQGIASYCFDFCGGSSYCKSTGKTTEMSILSEIEDLMHVFKDIKQLDFVDISNIFMLGESQGGIVAALASTLLKTDVTGLMLLYPAFNIPDNARSEYESYDLIPDRMGLWSVPLGGKYYRDIYKLDVYKSLKQYLGPVLIIHGSHDEIVPLECSKKALQCFSNASLKIIDYLGHGFYGPQTKNVSLKLIQFIKERMH